MFYANLNKVVFTNNVISVANQLPSIVYISKSMSWIQYVKLITTETIT